MEMSEIFMANELAEIQLFMAIIKAGNLSATRPGNELFAGGNEQDLSSLESRLGVDLVTRTSRSFEPTEEGSLFYERCQRNVADIAKVEAEASSRTGSVKRKLRVAAPNELGRRLIAP